MQGAVNGQTGSAASPPHTVGPPRPMSPAVGPQVPLRIRAWGRTGSCADSAVPGAPGTGVPPTTPRAAKLAAHVRTAAKHALEPSVGLRAPLKGLVGFGSLKGCGGFCSGTTGPLTGAGPDAAVPWFRSRRPRPRSRVRGPRAPDPKAVPDGRDGPPLIRLPSSWRPAVAPRA